MSHEISNAVFSQREGAGWTGLGLAIPADIAKNPKAIAELCNATYNVTKQPMFFKGTDGSFHAAPGHEVLVRSDNNVVLAPVSEARYNVENRQPCDIFDAFGEELAKENLEISHAAVLRGGSVIAVCATLPSQFDINVGGRDKVNSYVALSTGYDKKHGTKASFGTVRVVCANTLAASIAEGEATKRLQSIKASQIIAPGTLAALIVDVQKMVEQTRKTFEQLNNIRMTSDQVAAYFTKVLGEHIDQIDKTKEISTKTKNILANLSSAYNSAPGAGLASGTAWGALNAVTYYATHVKTVRDSFNSGTDAARVASNLDGDAARLKLRALELASQLAVAA